MAETFFNQMVRGRARAISAGSQPAETVNPIVAEAMSETGIDIADAKPQKLTPELLSQADMVISMGCGESCPVTTIAHRDWNLADPRRKNSGRGQAHPGRNTKKSKPAHRRTRDLTWL
jgi:arsenate reductase (thioredoxin)